jgi:hypothetical protein
VTASIPNDHHSSSWFPIATPSVLAWPATAHSRDPSRPQNPPHRRSAQLYLLLLGQAFAKVLVIEAAVLCLRQRDHLLRYPLRRPSPRTSAAVPMDNAILAPFLDPTPNPLHLAPAQPQHLRRFPYRQLASSYPSYCI